MKHMIQHHPVKPAESTGVKRRLSALTLSALAATLATSLNVSAQIAPDAGQILQDSLPQTVSPIAPSVDLNLQAPRSGEVAPGGPQATLRDVRFTGNSVYSSAQLMTVLGDVIGKSFDMAGLRTLVSTLEQHYRDQGYPFARVLIPTQSLAGGVLELEVVEGRYDTVSTSGDATLAAQAAPFLNGLKPGSVIESGPLERSTLILGDVPGIRVVPVMRPGTGPGTGSLDVQVVEAPRIKGGVGLDNQGNRYSGEYRAQGDMAINRLLMLGDELSARGLYTNQHTWLGQIAYALPLGYSGLRGNLSYAQTDYELGKEFSSLGATGLAKITTAGISYPLIRSQKTNLILGASYQHTRLDDRQSQSSYHKATRSHALPISLQFDHRDALGGGGLTYGRLQITPGRLKGDDTSGPMDKYSFTKTNLQVARLQRLTDTLTLFVNFNGQHSNRTALDGSESFSLGGPNGVRAFPVGEATDARGWLTQIELRYALNAQFSPYAFYDTGSTPRGNTDATRRTLGGAGAGLRFNHDRFSADISVAWKTKGGDAISDSKQRDPRVWASVSYRF